MCEDEHTDVTEYAGIKVKLNLLKGRIRGWGNAKRQEAIMKAAVNNSRKRYNADKERVDRLRDEMEQEEKRARREASAKVWLGHAQPYSFKPYPFESMPATLPQTNNANSLTKLLGQKPPLYSTPLKSPGRNTMTLPPRRNKAPLTSAAAQYMRSKYQTTYKGGRKTKKSKRKTRRN